MPFATVYDEYLAVLNTDRLDASRVRIDLFTNNYVPNRADSLAAFTLAAYPGYAQFNWPVSPFVVAGHKYSWAPAVARFPAPSSGSPVNVYGFVVTCHFVSLGGDPLLVVQAAQFTGAPVTLSVGDPDFLFNVFHRWFDAH